MQKKQDMDIKMSYEYMKNKFAESGNSFVFSNKQDTDKDIRINKIIDDLSMDLKDEDAR